MFQTQVMMMDILMASLLFILVVCLVMIIYGLIKVLYLVIMSRMMNRKMVMVNILRLVRTWYVLNYQVAVAVVSQAKYAPWAFMHMNLAMCWDYRIFMIGHPSPVVIQKVLVSGV